MQQMTTEISKSQNCNPTDSVKNRHNSIEFQIYKYEPNIDEDSSGREILVLGGYAAEYDEYLKSAL